jgi:hypothetical protein
MRDVVGFKIHRQGAKTQREIIIYDNTGNIIWTAGNTDLRFIQWCGTDIAGNMVKPGVYFYSIKYNGVLHSGRIIKTE